MKVGPDRWDVQPHQLLRAVLDDRLVREVLAHLQAPPDEVRATLDARWLATVDVLDPEVLNAAGIEIEQVLARVNPPFGRHLDWGGRKLDPASSQVLIRALHEAAPVRGQMITAGHLLLGLMRERDPVLKGTFAAHGLRIAEVRELVNRWGRRVR